MENNPLNKVWQNYEGKMLPWAENFRDLLHRNGYVMAWENRGCISLRGFRRLFL